VASKSIQGRAVPQDYPALNHFSLTLHEARSPASHRGRVYPTTSYV